MMCSVWKMRAFVSDVAAVGDAGSARWFVVGAWDRAGSRRRAVLGKVLEPQVMMIVVPADRAIGCGAYTKAGIVAQPAASWVA